MFFPGLYEKYSDKLPRTVSQVSQANPVYRSSLSGDTGIVLQTTLFGRSIEFASHYRQWNHLHTGTTK